MADALSELSGQPPIDPEAQSVVTDFLDYTEFFPSDLFRSLSLIGKLDQAYQDDARSIHELTSTYSKLPELPPHEQRDPRQIREQVSTKLDHALRSRESTFAEASRLCTVAENLYNRLVGIKAKLEAMPKPPSREPTPQPTTPSRPRRTLDNDRIPKLKLFTDGEKQNRRAGGPARPRKKPVFIVPGDVLPPMDSLSDVSSDSESDLPPHKSPIKAEPIKLAHEKKSLSLKIPKPPRPARPPKIAAPKPPKVVKVRPRGVMGTNVHSTVAGISVSNAMAALTPPPENPQIGSEWAPWRELTSWELHVIRRRMKKNANWQPSEVMLSKELDKLGRGEENYQRALVEAKAKGETVLDERPHKSTGKAKEALNQIIEAESQDLTVSTAEDHQVDDTAKDQRPKSSEGSKKENPAQKSNKQRVEQELKKVKADQAERAARQKEMEDQLARQMADAMRKAQEESDTLNQVLSGMRPVITPTSAVPSVETPTSASSKKKAPKKRKRESEPSSNTPALIAPKPPNAKSNDTTPSERPSSPKKLKLIAPKSTSGASNEPTPVSGTEQTSQVPLAPPGPSKDVPNAVLDEVPVDPMLIDEVPAEKSAADKQPSQRVSQTRKLRTPTPAPAAAAAAAPPEKAEEQPLAAHSPPHAREATVPPKSPSPPQAEEPVNTEAISEAKEDTDELAPSPEPTSPVSPKTLDNPNNKRPSISLRLPNNPPIDQAVGTNTSTNSPTKSTRQSSRRLSKTATPMAEPEPVSRSYETSPQHKGMTETAASRRSSRAKPAPVVTTTPAAPPPPPPPKPVLETATASRSKRGSTARKSSTISLPSPVPNSPTTSKKRQHSTTSRAAKISPSTSVAPSQPTQPNTNANLAFDSKTLKNLKPPKDTGYNRAGEPIYCLCRDVDHGTMIGCDGPGCPVEWFHLECVGLEVKPRVRSQWFCPFCRGESEGVPKAEAGV
ncbi:MAG: hypothetical protein Q9162_005238 [Coniocarpon cinnabarinum]